MTCDFSDAVGDVLQTGGDSIATGIDIPGGGASGGIQGLELTLQIWPKQEELGEEDQVKRRGQYCGNRNLLATCPSAAVS